MSNRSRKTKTKKIFYRILFSVELRETKREYERERERETVYVEIGGRGCIERENTRENALRISLKLRSEFGMKKRLFRVKSVCRGQKQPHSQTLICKNISDLFAPFIWS